MRHVARFYGRFLLPKGLRASELEVLGKRRHEGPMTIDALAKDPVPVRTFADGAEADR